MPLSGRSDRKKFLRGIIKGSEPLDLQSGFGDTRVKTDKIR
jgi:hypothetical protein